MSLLFHLVVSAVDLVDPWKWCVCVCVCMERGFVVLGKNVLLFCDLKLGHACPVHLVD